MHTVAHDVTQEGPLAWLKFFNTGPEFFMAVNGQLAFLERRCRKRGHSEFCADHEPYRLDMGRRFAR